MHRFYPRSSGSTRDSPGKWSLPRRERPFDRVCPDRCQRKRCPCQRRRTSSRLPAPTAPRRAEVPDGRPPQEVDAAVRAAYDARGPWRRTAPSDRAAALRAAAAAVRGRRTSWATRSARPPAGCCARRAQSARRGGRAARRGSGDRAGGGRAHAGRRPGRAGRGAGGAAGCRRGAHPVERPVPRRGRAGRGGARHRQHGGAQALGAQRRAGRPDGRAGRRVPAGRGAAGASRVAGDVGAQLAADGRVAVVAHVGSSATGRADQRRRRGQGRARCCWRTAARTRSSSTPAWTRPGRRSRSRWARSPTPASCARRSSASTSTPTSPRP